MHKCYQQTLEAIWSIPLASTCVFLCDTGLFGPKDGTGVNIQIQVGAIAIRRRWPKRDQSMLSYEWTRNGESELTADKTHRWRFIYYFN